LLCKPDSGVLLFNPCPSSNWYKDIIHNCAAHAREHYDPVEDKEDVVPAKGEPARGLVVVGNTKELLCVMSGAGKGHMGKKED
jgi:hypothetical protein